MLLAQRLTIAVVIVVLAACASAPTPVSTPPQRPITSLGQLAGTWTATNPDGQPVRLVMQPSGSFEAAITTRTGTVTRKGQARLDGGEVKYDADLSTGTITYHEEGQRQVFVLHGTMKPNTNTSYKTFDTMYTRVP